MNGSSTTGADSRTARGVLVIRDAEGGAATARRLGVIGLEPVMLPLARVAPTGNAIPAGGFDGLLITSANACRFLGGVDRNLPVMAVGEASAAAAREAGFGDVRTGGGDAASLVERLRDQASAGPCGANGRWLLAAGEERARDLAGELAPAGFDVVTVPVYRIERIDPGPEAMEAALSSARQGIHLFHSALAAGHFAGLVERHGLAALCREAAALAISAKTSHRLPEGLYRIVGVAKSPDEDAMMEMAAAMLAA